MRNVGLITTATGSAGGLFAQARGAQRPASQALLQTSPRGRCGASVLWPDVVWVCLLPEVAACIISAACVWTKFSRSCWLKGFSHYFVGQNWADDLEDETLKGLLPAFIRNSVLSKKQTPGSLLGPHKNTGTVSMTVQQASLSGAGTAHLCPEATLHEEANVASTLLHSVWGK